jgi:2-polyprenyl-6-methoxyphenol hydroxylase-like FAD-dependent oxidoreductase
MISVGAFWGGQSAARASRGSRRVLGAAEGNEPGRVAIVGAGFAGLALACALSRAGRRVTVLERRAALPATGAAIAIQPNGLSALERLGLLERARGAGSRIESLLMYDSRRRLVARVHYGELDAVTPFMLLVRRHELLRVLADGLTSLGGGPVLYGAEVFALIRRGESVRGLRYRRDGQDQELGAWCVAGADGVRSAVRRELAIPQRTWGHDQAYVVGIGARPAELEDGTAVVYHGAGYANGVMPLGDRAYFYDSVTPANRMAVEARDLDGWRAAYVARVPYGAELTAGLTRWDELTVLAARPGRASRRIADGAALLGDAAAVVHPHSAQGTNLALEDGVALGQLLARLDPSTALRRTGLAPYQRLRGRKAARYVAWSRWAGATFDGATTPWRAARWSGWQWQRVRPVRRLLLRLGAGLL